jgi:hypothetical protein
LDAQPKKTAKYSNKSSKNQKQNIYPKQEYISRTAVHARNETKPQSCFFKSQSADATNEHFRFPKDRPKKN